MDGKKMMNEEEQNLKELKDKLQIDKPKKRFYFVHAVKQTLAVMIFPTVVLYIIHLIFSSNDIIKWDWVLYGWLFCFILSGLGAYPIFKIKK